MNKNIDAPRRSLLDGLSANIAILDEAGVIVTVNKSWRDFATANGVSPESVSEGVDYLAVCDRSEADNDADARIWALGIREVLSGARDTFVKEYPCHSPEEQRWFEGRVTSFSDNSHKRVIVAHENITGQKLAEETLNRDKERLNSLGRIFQYDAPTSQELLDFALEETMRLTESTLGHVYLYNAERQIMQLSTWCSLDVQDEGGSFARSCCKLDDCPPWKQVVQSKTPLALKGPLQFLSGKSAVLEDETALLSYLVVPIVGGDKLIALIGLGNRPGGYSDTDILQTVLLMEAVWKVVERRQAEETLRLLEWMLTPGHGPAARAAREGKGTHGIVADFSEHNTQRQILDALGSEKLNSIVWESLDLLETSAVVYEVNGDHAMAVFVSDWCKLLYGASRAMCGTEDNGETLHSRQGLCHEACWRKTAQQAALTGVPVDAECIGGIRSYAVPIRAGEEIVGVINLAYGSPPRDPGQLIALAERFGVSVVDLAAAADKYETRPPFIIEMAKRRLEASARLIGEVVDRRRIEREYKLLFEQMLDGFALFEVMYDAQHTPVDLVFLAANPALEKLLGRKQSDLVGKTLLQVLPTVNRDWLRAVGNVAQTGVSLRRDEYSPLLRRHMNISAFRPLLGQIACLVADITERVSIQEDLRRERDLATRLIQDNPLAILIFDEEGMLAAWNKRAGELFVSREEDLPRRPYNASEWQITDLEGNPFRDELLPYRIVTRTGAPVYDIQLAVQAASGERIYLSVNGSPLFDQAGKIERVLLVMEDVTERKRTESELLLYQERLRSLASQLSASEERERYRLATYLHDDVAQLLALAKIKLGEISGEKRIESIQGMVQEARDVLTGAIEKTRTIGRDLYPLTLHQFGLSVALEVLAEEMAEGSPLKIMFKEDRQEKPLDTEMSALLYRSVRELLFNVIKHAKATSAQVAMTRTSDMVEITVEDNGIGFEPGQLYSKRSKNIKFGLFSVKERVEYAGGHLIMDASPGRGTRMTLQAPIHTVNE